MNLTRKIALVFALLVAGSAVSESALAHGYYGHTRVGVGFYFGGPYWGYGWGAPYYPYYAPYYYPPYPAYAPAQSTTYIQQDVQQAPAAPQQNYWYYCSDAQAYYPYVKECPGGWQRVAPQPSR